MPTITILFSRVYIFILLGYILGRYVRFNIQREAQGIINIGMYVLFPVFVLVTMWAEPLPTAFLSRVWLLAAGVVIGGAGLAWLFSRIYAMPYRDCSLPIIFINSAYLGIPVNTYILGPAATKYAIIFDLVPTLIMFTFGVALVAKGDRLKEMLKMPLAYAALIGMLLNAQGVPVPWPVLKITGFIKTITIPLILVIVGYELKPFKTTLLNRVLAASVLRMAGGAIMAFSLVSLLRLEGIPALVCLISASMPSAVNSYVLARKYQANAEFAAAVVAMGTLISLPVIMIISLLIHGKMI
ncbi:MAG: AEC family transporter [bacterium]|nr:AEC family transporter [bacterium]MDD5354119.1 AEC family transporter [bacterium]MDD5756009.1 AEC family transporter [bacterium]